VLFLFLQLKQLALFGLGVAPLASCPFACISRFMHQHKAHVPK
jgi:hypothetical protein